MFYIWLVWPIFQLLSPAASQIPGDEGTWRQRRRLTWWTRSTQGQKGHPISLLIQEILKTRGASNIFYYQRNISNRRDIQYFLLSKKYFKLEVYPISLHIQEKFQTRGTSNIFSYQRNISNRRDIKYILLSKKYFKLSLVIIEVMCALMRSLQLCLLNDISAGCLD